MDWRKIIYAVCGALFLFSAGLGAAEPESIVEQIKTGGHLIMIRHANAPGTGDPADFRIGDCTTQRNLDQRGRAQARQIGQWLSDRGITHARVYSSQWCRCLETAERIGLGPVTEMPALNSFFERPQDREPSLTALRRFLSAQPATGDLIVLVTHYVNISGITGEHVSSGDGVVIKLNGDAGYAVLGRLNFDF